MTTLVPALSIRAPWWWFIVHGYKGVENREWSTSVRGRVLIHASSWWSTTGVHEAFTNHAHLLPPSESLEERRREGDVVTLRMLREAGGHIVGEVTLVDCVKQSDSPWFTGPYGFVFKDAKVWEEPMRLRGRLGFFPVRVP